MTKKWSHSKSYRRLDCCSWDQQRQKTSDDITFIASSISSTDDSSRRCQWSSELATRTRIKLRCHTISLSGYYIYTKGRRRIKHGREKHDWNLGAVKQRFWWGRRVNDETSWISSFVARKIRALVARIMRAWSSRYSSSTRYWQRYPYRRTQRRERIQEVSYNAKSWGTQRSACPAVQVSLINQTEVQMGWYYEDRHGGSAAWVRWRLYASSCHHKWLCVTYGRKRWPLLSPAPPSSWTTPAVPSTPAPDSHDKTSPPPSNFPPPTFGRRKWLKPWVKEPPITKAPTSTTVRMKTMLLTSLLALPGAWRKLMGLDGRPNHDSDKPDRVGKSLHCAYLTIEAEPPTAHRHAKRANDKCFPGQCAGEKQSGRNSPKRSRSKINFERARTRRHSTGSSIVSDFHHWNDPQAIGIPWSSYRSYVLYLQLMLGVNTRTPLYITPTHCVQQKNHGFGTASVDIRSVLHGMHNLLGPIGVWKTQLCHSGTITGWDDTKNINYGE